MTPTSCVAQADCSSLEVDPGALMVGIVWRAPRIESAASRLALRIRRSSATARTASGRRPLGLVGVRLKSTNFECFPQRSQIRLRP